MGKIIFSEGRDDLVAASKDSLTAGDVKEIPLYKLQSGKHQPRTYFNNDSLIELAESIKQQGILQPLLVRELQSGKLEIIAGERRWRAAQKIGLKTVPCIQRSLSEEDAGAVALIENIQREDLNALEEAIAYSKLIKAHGLTHEEIARRVGKSRPTIANSIRLLNLTESVKKSLVIKEIEAGHAKALLSLSDDEQESALKIIIEKKYNVRQTERYVKELLFKKEDNCSNKGAADHHALEYEYTRKICSYWQPGVKVLFSNSSQNAGTVNLRFNTREQLHSLISLLEANNVEVN